MESDQKRQLYPTPSRFLQSLGGAVTLTRGNGNEAKYQSNGTGGFAAQDAGQRNTFVRDDANGLWKENTPDGRVMAYLATLKNMDLTLHLREGENSMEFSPSHTHLLKHFQNFERVLHSL